MELNNSKIYLGGIQINKAYLGSTILFGMENVVEPTSSINSIDLDQPVE